MSRNVGEGKKRVTVVESTLVARVVRYRKACKCWVASKAHELGVRRRGAVFVQGKRAAPGRDQKQGKLPRLDAGEGTDPDE